jgi:Cupin-like domain
MTLLEFDEESFLDHFDRLAFSHRHALAGHPLLGLDAIGRLAAALPIEDVEHNPGALPIGVDPRAVPRTSRTVGETLRAIDSAGAWVALKYIEKQAHYGTLLERCLADIRPLTQKLAPGLCQPHAFLFVSSPSAVTPYHIDPEHNFLLQIQGRKCVTVWDPADREAVSELDLERFLSGGRHRNLPWHEGLAGRGVRFELGPGDGLHIPVTAPHWVQNLDEVSVSLSVTFRSEVSEAREAVFKVNRLLRTLRLAPRPVGTWPLVDGLKGRAFGVARRVAHLVR